MTLLFGTERVLVLQRTHSTNGPLYWPQLPLFYPKKLDLVMRRCEVKNSSATQLGK